MPPVTVARRWLEGCGAPAAVIVAACFAPPAALAQAPAAPPAPAPVPAPVAAPAPSPAPPAGNDAAARLDPVEVQGSRPDEVQERRQSTAAKTVIGRDEIERFGDSTLGDVLKRLPGITIQGRPGRGGQIRMRGLGNGYTQILLDGERIPPGFSLDSLTPDQIERIEIYRAPTAETGARAIAGTINIVTRGGYTKRVNDVKVTLGREDGLLQPSLSWTRNLTAGEFVVNYSLTGFLRRQDDPSHTATTQRQLSDDALVEQRQIDTRSTSRNHGVHATGRVEWRPAGSRGQLTLTPVLIVSRSSFTSRSLLTQEVGAVAPPYDEAATEGRSGFSLARLNAVWNHRLVDGRFELRGSAGRTRIDADNLRTEQIGGATSRSLANTTDIRDTSLMGGAKLTKTIAESHNVVTGVEFESNRRADGRSTRQDGVPVLTEFGDRLSARALRLAGYAQDEWDVTSRFAAHAGLRWEGIATRGSGAAGEDEPENRSSVWTPLLHAVWKPDPASRDQVRISLTRSYKSPTLQQLIARPRINTTYPVPGPNTPTSPDYAGNPDLKPELATGIDLAVERYLPGSGVLSASVFRRNITDYLRSVTLLETVPYSATPRYVIRPRNVGKATTEGIELEAKFRASEVWKGAPRVDLRANASAYRSKVDEVPGPDNRLDQQPGYTANVGADYRFTGVPLTVGGNVNWTPGYTTRISATQTATLGRKLVADAYGLWTFSPALALRLSVSNLAADDYVYGSTVDGPDLRGVPVRESSTTRLSTGVSVQARLELKL